MGKTIIVITAQYYWFIVKEAICQHMGMAVFNKTLFITSNRGPDMAYQLQFVEPCSTLWYNLSKWQMCILWVPNSNLRPGTIRFLAFTFEWDGISRVCHRRHGARSWLPFPPGLPIPPCPQWGSGVLGWSLGWDTGCLDFRRSSGYGNLSKPFRPQLPISYFQNRSLS